MHETAIVSSLFEVIQRQIAEHDIPRVIRVNLKIGDFAVVEPMTLRACFEVFAEGTVVEGAELVIQRVPIVGRCRRCGHQFEVKNHDFRCLGCANSSVEMLSGKELYIDSLDVEA
ncbi:putative hydrogenase nickel incorporation protein HypA [Desulfuromonas versatilis]|uniref:Hydrogenase maturation factor HypA n=1 Tax=Desulfuromonas versatilis TaxID=2802975 RepID=A0ABM8HNR9_9BACT|nr:hydrogenase maturation nickel metallochaperone HypA [Desulfuromonas versatilis]BCR03159.1 putative hydrogenase nickel incorporation protein HypA [Desulfuromonas versatilis]